MSESQYHIGALFSAEWREFKDPETGRLTTQLTNGTGGSYPLYYFIPSITADGRYLIFHSERSGSVQLYRLDLTTGEIGQLTDGHSTKAGWTIWCTRHLDGIYNHLSALDLISNEVYYFQNDEIRATNVLTFANRLVAKLPAGRMSIGQTMFSPDGSLFAFIHADEKKYNAILDEKEKTPIGLSDFRNMIGDVTLGLIETKTGNYREVITRDFHFHHVLFLDDKTLLVNHPKGCTGMWTVGTDGKNIRHLRPRTAEGAHDAEICHQIITDNGILYEANFRQDDQHRVYLGRYDEKTDTFEEVLLPDVGYVHAGNDPAGKFLFLEIAGKTHEIRSLHFPRDPSRLSMQTIRRLAPFREGQRNHAHPFLTPDRKWMIFTDDSENGFNQVYRINIEDLSSRNEYW
ncbi:MAG: hypothetical protein ABI615_11705 [Chthoniobacterales bacterium]